MAHHYSGNVPAHYEAYLASIFFDPYARETGQLVARHDPQTVLEVACGTGIVTRYLADALAPGTLLVATDINPAMLDEARARVPADGAVHLHWETADGMDLPYDDEQFEAVVCQFGVMLFPDRVRGMAEARRVLLAGGHYCFTVWDALEHNMVGLVAHEVITGFFPENPPRFYEAPFAYHDEGQIRRDLEAAGWENFTVTSEKKTGYSPSADEAAHGLIEGTPVHAAIVERDAAMVPAIKAALAAALAQRFGAKDLQFPLQAWRVVGVKK